MAPPPLASPVRHARLDGLDGLVFGGFVAATPESNQIRTAEQEASAHLARAVARARRVILWERIWPALVGAGIVAALFLAASWAGLWITLPPLGRIIGVGLFALVMAWRLWPLAQVRPATRAEALARLDRSSALAHRPATAMADDIATRPDDPVSAALWRAHMARTLASVRRLKAGIPTPGMAARDPRAFRALALLVLVPSFFFAGSEHVSRILSAFNWKGAVVQAPYRLDAWVDPPGYTGRAPVVLPGLRSDEVTQTQGTAISVPAGSVLVVRTVGLDAAALRADPGIVEVKATEATAEGQPAKPTEPARPGAATERRFTITQSGGVTFTGPDQRAVVWRFQAQPDTMPTISFVKDPQAGARNALVLAYRIEDDYGAKEATAHFAPAPPERPFFARPDRSTPSPGKPLVAAPDFPLALPMGGKSGAQTTKDLVTHPWAGANVMITLKVKDEAGHEAASETKTFRLPARSFSNPLARALIEERRTLALDVGARNRVETVLSALTLAPDKFGMEAGTFLGLRSAYWRLQNARSEDDLRGVVDYLWEMALAIEDGNLSDAQRELRAAQQALREALERGASDEEIQRLMQDLRAAMDKMMRQLAEEAKRDGGTDARPLDQNSRILRPQDLQRMMDQIENLARSGSRDAARQMLDELQAMMDNLRPGNRQAGRQQGQQSELGNMIQEQQRLRDRTFRQGQQGQQGQPGQRGQRGQQGQQGQQGEPGEYGDLQQGQQELRRRLGKMLDDLRRMQEGQGQGQQGQGQQGEGQQGEGEGEGGEGAMGRAGEAFGRAEQAMRDAEGALGQGNGQGALDSQGRALQALRQGAQAMAEAQQGNSDGPGPGGPGGEQATRTDPLGRPLRNQDYGDDFTVKVPNEVDVQRARQVLEELRRRLEQTNRPQLELDYIERLLENF